MAGRGVVAHQRSPAPCLASPACKRTGSSRKRGEENPGVQSQAGAHDGRQQQALREGGGAEQRAAPAKSVRAGRGGQHPGHGNEEAQHAQACGAAKGSNQRRKVFCVCLGGRGPGRVRGVGGPAGHTAAMAACSVSFVR